MKLLFYFLILTSLAIAEEDIEYNPYVKQKIVIIMSTTKYQDALARAKEASDKLSLPMNLRDLEPHNKTGLTFTKEKCLKEWGSFPCYIARGRFDNGSYVSIEYSSAYKEFRKGQYIVVIASHEKGKHELNEIVSNAKRYYSDAYAKDTNIYMGCMH